MPVCPPIKDPLALEPGEIHIWMSFYERPDAPDEIDCREFLNADERAKEARLYFPIDRREYCVARALVRQTLSLYAPVHPADWIFSSNSFGRPEIVNDAALRLELSFNLSHTRGLIVFAVTKRRIVGLDVENIASRRASIDLADRYFARDEVDALRAAPLHLQTYRFLEYWTFKESYIKARGMGLSLPLDKFSFHYPEEGKVSLVTQPELEDDAERWRFWQFRPSSEHLVAVCAEATATASPVICGVGPGASPLTPKFLRTSGMRR